MNIVKLIGITTPIVDVEDSIGPITAEELVAYAARVSNPSNQNNVLTSTKLLKYLAEHQHWSPFEMVHLVMEINTTRDIARQILRHRSFSFQEFSQRYAVATDLGFDTREARLQDQKNRQNSIETNSVGLQAGWEHYQHKVLHVVNEAYQWALSQGIAKEQARVVLPEGLTRSKMYMSGTLRSWIHYVQIRADKATQKEHRLIAEQCKNVILKKFPSIASILEDESV